MKENQKAVVQVLGTFLQRVTYELLQGNELSEEDALLLADIEYVYRYRQFREIVTKHYSTKN